VVSDVEDPPLVAHATDVPDEYALQGFDHVRGYSDEPERSAPLLRDGLGMNHLSDDVWEARGERRGGRIVYDRTTDRGVPGAGTVHHVAWATTHAELEQARRQVIVSGAHPTPVIDRFYFMSVYFREPSGILFELATDGPGFAVDEPLETLGQALSLPPRFEPLRERLAQELTPLPDTRPWRRATQPAQPN
jgi:glyoxalase family protein